MISDQDLLRSSIVRRVAAKVAAYPHVKTAAELPTFGIGHVVQALGTKIAYAHLRRARIANALASVKEI